MRAASILQPSMPFRRYPGGMLIPTDGVFDEPHCFVTGATRGIDCHHIYFGNPGRRVSDESGFWVYIRHDLHMALHDHRPPCETLDADLKRMCQERFEETGGTRDEFIALVGRSYI